MAKPQDFSDDLAVLDTTVRGEVDTILKLVRENERKEEPRPRTLPSDAPASVTSEKDVLEPEPLEATPKKGRRTTPRSASALAADEQVVMENVTTRLRRQTNELLTEAALRQKLKKENPSTRQDIIEVALQGWFRKQGYQSSGSSDE